MTFQTLKNPLVYITMILFLTNQMIENWLSFTVPVIHAYLDDLLCMPVILGLSTQIIQWIHPLRDLYHLDKKAITIVVLFYSILFEGILPMVELSTYTADWIDVILYSLGGFTYYNLISKKVKRDYLALLYKL
ncbi:magnesium citrate secondary transporter [Marivirga harenae]|uniref:magnesium citrate secondary transporter n=1 Tax=Marivirga harenae TaxID=2010992 RepID=UPI0026DFF7BE|nr:magnesium citrate secondary transporter [Marivirga harenae]WKV12385.1 magnesium citrate secondary transporter [Marivirga harenae]